MLRKEEQQQQQQQRHGLADSETCASRFSSLPRETTDAAETWRKKSEGGGGRVETFSPSSPSLRSHPNPSEQALW